MNTTSIRPGDTPVEIVDEGSVSEPKESPEIIPHFQLRALRITEEGWGKGWMLLPLPMRRSWMDEQPYSYQCPPLVMANQWGWQITCPAEVKVSWDGSSDPSGLHIEVEPQYAGSIKSQFGQGIVTFGPPWLFRTPKGWDLLVKGPSNHWKPNCAPLEGVIETWWLPYTFTLNWKVVTPGVVTFARGEPLAQIMPVPHFTFRESTAVEVPIASDSDASAQMAHWAAERERRSKEKVTTHHFYRKADGIAGHLNKIPVPKIMRNELNEL